MGGIRALIERIAQQPARIRSRLVAMMSKADLLFFANCFTAWANSAQLPPKGNGWRTWMIMAGRGFGKTRAGAEWVQSIATRRGRPVRIALVGANPAEVRNVMIEGDSGILAIAPRRRRPKWEPSLGRLSWPGGSTAYVYSGENPDGLRGAQHHYAWCDEIAKWGHGTESWDNLQLGLRLGERPRTLVTTTPRPVPVVKRILGAAGTVETRGRTADNATLTKRFIDEVTKDYGGTRLGRQELDGILIEDVEGALWSRAGIEAARSRAAGPWKRVVIGVDPPASQSGDSCGIVAVALGEDERAYVIGDHSVSGLSPQGWAQAVSAAAQAHGADRVVVEKNMGGNMVEAVLKSADFTLPVAPAHAHESKTARAEPVSLLFEAGKARFAGAFPQLEDELAGMTMADGYHGPGRSPDRADAMVWAMSELMLSRKAARPRVRGL